MRKGFTVNNSHNDSGRSIPLLDEYSRGELDDLTPSAQSVYALLRCSGPCTQADLRRATGFHEETIRTALRTLKQRGLCVETKASSESSGYRQYLIDPSDLYTSQPTP